MASIHVLSLVSYVLLASSIHVKKDDPAGMLLENDPEGFLLEDPDSDCGRGKNCGEVVGHTHAPMSVQCSDGEKWFARNALFIRGQKGKNGIYCSVPKIGTSYVFGVLSDLHLAVRGGKRNAGFEAVHEIISANKSDQIEELCNAYSFMVIRNPWDRLASGYVDKVLTAEVFKTPPSFNKFMHMLVAVKDPGSINQHFRPASQLCQTTGENAMHFDEAIKIEGNLRNHLQEIFINKLGLPKTQVVKVLDTWDEQTHSTKAGGRWEEIDKSLSSDLDRVTYYFKQTDPGLVRRVYKDDIAFGNYVYGKSGY